MEEDRQRSPAQPLYLHIFLASPGDVVEERAMARAVMEALPKDPLLHDRITVDVVAWDGPGGAVMDASMTPQAAIKLGLTRPSSCDIAVVIFWSRMGTPLPTDWEVKANGSPYRSGTEWEYLDALQASKKTGRPKVLVYRRTEVPNIAANDPERDQRMKQWDAIEAFFAEFRNTDGSLKGAYTEYKLPTEFREKLVNDLRELVKDCLKAPLGPTPPDIAHSALAELIELGELILKLHHFKSIAERLHELYMDKDVRFLRSQAPQSLSKQSLKRAAHSGERALEDIQALEEPKLLPTEKNAKDNKLSRLGAAVQDLLAAGTVQASDKPDAGSTEDAVADFTYDLTLLRDSFNNLAEESWRKLALGELGTKFDRVRDPLSVNYPAYMARVDEGYRAITGQPPLFVKCNHLANEHALLEKALKDLAGVERLLQTNFATATLASSCARIKSFVDGAQSYWDQFLAAASPADGWAIALFNSGKVDWDGINKCRDEMGAVLEKADPSQRDALLNKLRETQENLEPHFQAVDEALAGAFREVKNRLGEALTAVPAGAEV